MARHLEAGAGGHRRGRILEDAAGYFNDSAARVAADVFVVLDDLARPSRLEGPDLSLLLAAYAQVSSEPDSGANPLD